MQNVFKKVKRKKKRLIFPRTPEKDPPKRKKYIDPVVVPSKIFREHYSSKHNKKNKNRLKEKSKQKKQMGLYKATFLSLSIMASFI